jgi:acetolactate synthase-1/2/3 large subunit
MPLIVPANEQGAGFMAAGYARASGRVGVCMVTSGPGATNTVTPVRDCMADSVPIVVICGQVPTSAIGTDAFQEAPVAAIMGSVAKHVFLVTDPHAARGTVRTAFEIAARAGPGRWSSTCRRTCRTGGTFRATGCCRSRLPQAHRRGNGTIRGDEAAKSFFDMLRSREAPADLCRRRRGQRGMRRRAARVRAAIRHSRWSPR